MTITAALAITTLATASAFGQVTFQTVPYLQKQGSSLLTVGDVNGDGNPDVVILDHVSSQISTLLGK